MGREGTISRQKSLRDCFLVSAHGTRSRLKENQFAMATYDHHSDSAHCTAYSVFPRQRLPIDSYSVAFPDTEKQERPVPSPLRAGEDGPIFQDVLLESSGKPRALNRWAIVCSLVFQLLLLLALFVASLFHTEVLPKREMLTMLVVPPPAAASAVPTFRVPTTSRSMSIPKAVPKTQEAPPPPVATTGGVLGGVPGGVVGSPDGVLGTFPASTPSAPVMAKAPEPTKRMRVASRVAEANLIHDVAPTYPPEAGRARIEGTVVLRAVIGKDGIVRDVRVESGLPVLIQAAIDAVKQWRYKPYLVNGEPIEIDSQITINFTLSGG